MRTSSLRKSEAAVEEKKVLSPNVAISGMEQILLVQASNSGLGDKVQSLLERFQLKERFALNIVSDVDQAYRQINETPYRLICIEMYVTIIPEERGHRSFHLRDGFDLAYKVEKERWENREGIEDKINFNTPILVLPQYSALMYAYDTLTMSPEEKVKLERTPNKYLRVSFEFNDL